VVWLPDGEKNFTIGSAVLTQYRTVTDTDGHRTTAIARLLRRAGKNGWTDRAYTTERKWLVGNELGRPHGFPMMLIKIKCRPIEVEDINI